LDIQLQQICSANTRNHRMPSFSVTRSININASQQRVFDAIADFKTWTTWSPWLCAEPDAAVTVSDDSNSVGSLYSWAGNVVGAGEVQHQSFDGLNRINDEIRFLKPWKSTSKVSFELKPAGDGTHVSWTMDGSLPWFMFWMKPMMEPFIGMDYDRGLKMLKEWLETGAIASDTQVLGVESVGPIRMAGVPRTSHISDISAEMGQAITEAEEKLSKLGLPASEGISVYTKFKMKQGIMSYISGFTIPESAPQELDGLTTWSLPASTAFRVDHRGSYEHLGNAWSAANQHVRYKKMKQSKAGTFEIYRKSPSDVEHCRDLETEIYLPLR
jgi:predicted transcriptional regulator YdeE